MPPHPFLTPLPSSCSCVRPPPQELEFELPVEDETGRKQGIGEAEAADSPSDDDDSSPPVLRVTLSNGGEMALRPREVQVKRVP